MTRGDDGTSLESILGSHLERVYELNRDVDELARLNRVAPGEVISAGTRVKLVEGARR